MITLLIFTIVAVALVEGLGSYLCKIWRFSPNLLMIFCLPAEVVAGDIGYRAGGGYWAAIAGALFLGLAQSTIGLWLMNRSHPNFWHRARPWSLWRYMVFCVCFAPFIAVPLGLLGGVFAAAW